MKVPGFGPLDAEVMYIAEGPGFDEDLSGLPFYDYDFYREHSPNYVVRIRNGGKSGREFTRYTNRSAKIPRETAYVTNLVKYRPETNKPGKGNNAPTAADIARDEPELVEEISRVRPKIVCAIGRYSARWFLGNVSIDDSHGLCFPIPEDRRDHIRRIAGLHLPVQDAGRRADRHGKGSSPASRGRNLDGDGGAVQALDDWLDSVRVVVCTHPASGLHNSESQPQIDRDFLWLGKYVRGEVSLDPPVDRYPDPDYYEQKVPVAALSPRDVAVDTESRLDGSNVWCASYTFNPGSGAVVRAANRHLIPSLRAMLGVHRAGFWNAPHDLRVLAKWFGVPVFDYATSIRFECLMQMAYVTRILPLSLKVEAKRYESMPMRPYNAVVGPADQEHAERYLLRALENVCPTCEGACLVMDENRIGKTGKPLAPKPVKCPACEGDGTAWAPPEEHMEWDRANQRIRIGRGQRMGTRIRKALDRTTTVKVAADLDADAEEFTPPAIDADDDTDESTSADDEKQATGLRKWFTKSLDYAFRLQVEERLGPMPEATLDDIPLQEAVDYAARDADAAMRRWPAVEGLLRSEGLWDVYTADRDAMPMICQMMEVGWKIDVPYLGELSRELSVQMDVLEYQLEQLAGHYVNPNSPDQVADLLFDELGLEPIKITDSGKPSTANKILSDLQIQAAGRMDAEPEMARAFEAVKLVLGARELSKLRGTYTVKLPRMVDERDRLHTYLKSASTASRRLSSEDPNLQNIPARTETGKLIRKAFVCEDGTVLLGADYAQVEVRILAHESGDKTLIKAIRDGVDIHSLTASKVFGIPVDKVEKSSWQRLISKRITFGIAYGISAMELKAQVKLIAGIDVPVEVCQSWIDDYKTKSYPAVGEYIDDSIAMARRYGYAQDGWGHRRYLPGLHSPLRGVRAESERIAVNHRIQSYASGVIKLAMGALTPVMKKYRKKAYCEPLMQIHDELDFEVHESIAVPFMAEVERVMGSVVELSVPIVAEGKIGKRWSDLKD